MDVEHERERGFKKEVGVRGQGRVGGLHLDGE